MRYCAKGCNEFPHIHPNPIGKYGRYPINDLTLRRLAEASQLHPAVVYYNAKLLKKVIDAG